MNLIRAKYIAVFFFFSLLPTVVDAQTLVGSASSCTNANLDGSYGYTVSGFIFETVSGEEETLPFADGGTMTFDGNGNITGSSTYSLEGGIQGRTFTGTYSVSSNCTGVIKFTDSLGAAEVLNLVIGGNGQSFQIVEYDSNTEVSGSAAIRQTNCTTDSINGSYNLVLGGYLFDSSGDEATFTDGGQITSNGNGNFTIADTISTEGTISFRSTGTYSLNSGCTGTAALEDPNLGTANFNIIVVAGGIVFMETDAVTTTAIGTVISGMATALGNVVAGGTMGHLASGGGWETQFTLINSGTSSAQIQLDFFDNNGNALSLPVTNVQTGGSTTSSSITETIAAGASLVLLTQGSSSATVTEGSAQLTASGSTAIGGYAIFAYSPTKQSAVVPLETRNPAAFVLGFDNTNGQSTGVALANVSDQSAKVSMIIRDGIGTVIDKTSVSLAARGHTAFVLPTTYSATEKQRGTVEFDTPAGGQISVLGILASPTLAFTTIPSLVK